MEVVYCKDCKYSMRWRSGEAAQKYGEELECSKNIILAPDAYDFCCKGKPIIRCPKCNKRFDYSIPNYCPDCGCKMCGGEQNESN